MSKKVYVIVGLGFGDEGKGLATDYLCSQAEDPIVVRFNGGHQAGHTVVTNKGYSQVFSHFGSGSMRGVPTFWSKYCTVAPGYLLEEYNLLDIKPILLVDPLCPITTHYDVLYNRALEASLGDSKIGSCGVGFAPTIERHYSEIPFTFQDISNPEIVRKKLVQIRSYYKEKFNANTCYNFSQFEHEQEDDAFTDPIKEICRLIEEGVMKLTVFDEIFSAQKWNTYIFEGAQGVLLDQNFGFLPHITKSNTTSQNAFELLSPYLNFEAFQIDLLYVTRAYSTRHGAGPFNQYLPNIELEDNHSESNLFNEYQGEFRIGHLDIDLLNYSLRCDSRFSVGIRKNILVTCLDHLHDANALTVYRDGHPHTIAYKELVKFLNSDFHQVMYSYSNCSENLIIYRNL